MFYFYLCSMSIEIQINSHKFILHPSGAIYWKDKKMLLIADVHLGKVAHFRKHGAPIPANAAYKNLEELTEISNFFQPETICFLGDLFHSKAGIILISGNHDIIPQYLYQEIGVKIYDALIIEEFLFTHHPTPTEGLFNFYGHIHPGVHLRGVGRQYLRFSCFYKSVNSLILPAFGNFTGKHILKPSKNDEVFAIVEGEVIQLTK